MCRPAASGVLKLARHILHEIFRPWCLSACRWSWAASNVENVLEHIWQEMLRGQCRFTLLCSCAASSDPNSAPHFRHLNRGQWLSFSATGWFVTCWLTASFCRYFLSQPSHPNSGPFLSYWSGFLDRKTRGEVAARFSGGLFFSSWSPTTALAPVHH
jgi:hypothetical protein